MRWLPLTLVSLVLVTSGFAGTAEFVRIWPQWREADAFDRIREYFGGQENDGREIVLRSHPEQRAGLYFLVRVKSAEALPQARFVLEIIRPDSPDAKTFTFRTSLPAKGGVVELGLTDGDWPGGRTTHPVAWKLTLLDSGDHVVTSEQSFLWSMPAK